MTGKMAMSETAEKPVSQDIAGMPFPRHEVAVDLTDLGSTRFVVTVDTEEEFDWNGPFTRDQHGMRHISAIPRFQNLCDDRGVKPCYLIDYPVATDRYAADMLGTFCHDDRAEIGVQLHPWVNPPFDEAVTVQNSYACNLPPALEREKLTRLYNAIVANTGISPDSYRAGRYGAGPETPAILMDLGIAIDSSVRARFDYSDQGGPDYSDHPVNPYWISPGRLLEFPLTTVFAGAMRASGDVLFGKMFGSDASRSLLSRTTLLERIALTPEGIPLKKAIEGINLALESDVKIINLSFHSPSLAPGFTPYVRDENDLGEFYGWWSAVFDHLEKHGVRPVTMAEIKAATFGRFTLS